MLPAILASTTAMVRELLRFESVRATFVEQTSATSTALQYDVFGRFRQIKTKQDLTTFSGPNLVGNRSG